jgi:hypothetical protein
VDRKHTNLTSRRLFSVTDFNRPLRKRSATRCPRFGWKSVPEPPTSPAELLEAILSVVSRYLAGAAAAVVGAGFGSAAEPEERVGATRENRGHQGKLELGDLITTGPILNASKAQ